jgi:hypothetical protein
LEIGTLANHARTAARILWPVTVLSSLNLTQVFGHNERDIVAQFSRYQLERTDILNSDTNARLSIDKIIKPKFGSCGSENGASTRNHLGF